MAADDLAMQVRSAKKSAALVLTLFCQIIPATASETLRDSEEIYIIALISLLQNMKW